MTWRHEAEAWRLGLVVFDEAFARAASERAGAIPCARGCSSCCEGAAIFSVHAADAALLAAGLEQAHASTREAVLGRARELLDRVRLAASDLAAEGESLLEGWEPEDGWSLLPARVLDRLADRVPGACPVLSGDGACSLHEHRPAICRLQGAPWRDPETGQELADFCRLDERQGSQLPVEGPLHGLDELRERLRLRLGDAGGPGREGRTIVASALVAAHAGSG